MPTLRSVLSKKTDTFDVDQTLKKYPWLTAKEQNCIISPDADGLLCGLMMSHLFHWKIQGFYDGKVLVKKHGIPVSSCVFLDMEIFRPEIRSVGQHMLLYNKNHTPPEWSGFDNCFFINNLRNYDGCHDFRLKYPFGTIHFLATAVHRACKLSIPKSAICTVLFVDGTYHNLFRYTENSRDWLRYLEIDEPENPLHRVFVEEKYTIRSLMDGMDEFWRARDEISSVRGERGDRVAISPRGKSLNPSNLEKEGTLSRFNDDARRRAELFIGLLAKTFEWDYESKDWCWAGWDTFRFTKSDFVKDKKRANETTFNSLIDKAPLSFAMTRGGVYEYTLEGPDSF